MRIYTEVNYIWKDDKLVQTDSKSYEYSGEITRCDERKGGPRWARFNIPHSHWVAPTVADIKPQGGSTADLSNAISTGVKSGTTAITAGIKRINKDNPNPNLNLQTPKDFYDKTRDALHDAATNVSGIIDKNTDTISQYGDDATDDLINQITTIASDLVDTDGDGGGGSGLLEDSEPGTRGTAGRGKYFASGRSTSGRRGIEKKQTLASSLITKYKQKHL